MAYNFQNTFNAMLRPPVLQADPQQQQPVLPPQQQYNPNNLIPNSNTPWCIDNMPWAQPPDSNLGAIMHFEAHSYYDENTRRALLHVKRKPTEANATVAPPPKQFITEEKITAHFNGLHISNNFPKNDENSTSFSSMEDDSSMGTSLSSLQDYRVTAKELEEKLRNANRITLCEDFKKMQDEQKRNSLTDIVPEVLLNRIEKPCTSLVLWQPPPIIELLHRKNDEELKKGSEATATTNGEDEIIEDIEFAETDDIDDDFSNNNNTCNIDYNKFSAEMDEDL